jgi:hypothetical protein
MPPDDGRYEGVWMSRLSKAEKEWKRVRGLLYNEHPGYFDYEDSEKL